MKRLLLLLALFIAAPTFAATISGTVTQASNGSPLPGMTVQAYDTTGALRTSATTNAAGQYSLTVTAGQYHVLAFDPSGTFATSFYPSAESFETSAVLDVQTSATNINFALVHGGMLSGTVSSTSGSPLDGITVAAYNPDGTRRGFTHTDSAGHYQLVLPPGTYRIAAYDESLHYLTSFYEDATGFVTATPVTIVAAQTTTANFALILGTKVRGTVTDAASGAPIANAAVSFYLDGVVAATAGTDANGGYGVLLPPGVYRIVVFDPAGDYAPLYETGAESFDRSTLFTLNGGDTTTVDARLVRAGHFIGTVTDAGSGFTLPNVTVVAYNPDGTTRAFTTTDTNGFYALVVPPGLYRLAAYDPTLVFLTRFYPNQTTFASAVALQATTVQPVTANLALPRGAVVSGQVMTAAQSAVAGMTVGAYSSTGLAASATTDATGHYRLLLEPNAYLLAAFDPAFHFATAYAAIGVAMGQTIDNQNFTVVPGAHVSGVVRSDAGTPLAGMTVAAYDSNGALVSKADSRSNGSYDLVVAPGQYTFAAYDPQQRYNASPVSSPVTLAVSQSLSMSFTLRSSNPLPRHRAAAH